MQAVQARTRITLKNILLTTDFSPAAEAAAPFAIQIARNYGAKVYGVHVNPFDNYAAAAPEAWAAMAEAADKETKEHAQRLNDQLKGIEHPETGELVRPAQVAEAKVRKLRQLVSEQAELWCEPKYFVEQGIPAEKILELAEMRHASLIVMGARPVMGFTSHLNAGTVHKVVSQAKCPG